MSYQEFEYMSPSGTAIKVIEVTTENTTSFIDKKPETESTTIIGSTGQMTSYGSGEMTTETNYVDNNALESATSSGSSGQMTTYGSGEMTTQTNYVDNNALESATSSGSSGQMTTYGSGEMTTQTNYVDNNALESATSSGSSGQNNRLCLPFDCFGPYSRLISAVLTLQMLTIVFLLYHIPMLLINGQCLSCSPKFEIFGQQYYRMFGRYYYACDVMNLFLSMTVFADSMIGIWHYCGEHYSVDLYFGPLMFVVSIFAMVMRFYVLGAFILLSSVLKIFTSFLRRAHEL